MHSTPALQEVVINSLPLGEGGFKFVHTLANLKTDEGKSKFLPVFYRNSKFFPHPPQCEHWGTFPQGKAIFDSFLYGDYNREKRLQGEPYAKHY